MAKPRKSTLDSFLDQFCDFDLDSQARALDLMNWEYHRAQVRAKKTSAESKATPAAHSYDKGLSIDLPVPGVVQQSVTQPNNGVLPFDPAVPKAIKSIP